MENTFVVTFICGNTKKQRLRKANLGNVQRANAKEHFCQK